MTADNFAVRLAQAKLSTKANIDDFIKETDFDNKLKNALRINQKMYLLKRN